MEARNLLHRLLEYIGVQAKTIDPRGFKLGSLKGFVRHWDAIAGLPGVEFDLKVAGDHIWLRVPRLTASSPPATNENIKGLFKISMNPCGDNPSLDEAAFLNRLNTLTEKKDVNEHKDIEAKLRAKTAQALEEYAGMWKSWAEGEQPIRKTIAVYGDLFALKHQLEAEETSKPQEILWGIGIASWHLKFKNESIDFEYPLITQSMEISLAENTMAIELRPRATDPRVELDAFVACQVIGTAEVERTVRDHLSKQKDRPVTPFDPSSHSDVLKLIASNLDSNGTYLEVLNKERKTLPTNEHLKITDEWVLLSRPRSNSYLFEDLKRLQIKLEEGCDIPAGPLSLVSPPSDKPIEYEAVRFRGLSSRGSSGSGSTEELYFPLPYNEEQVTIVQRLERAPGVAVQGPPGTGKTHTIANIICHYLATGRRVLVTSRGEQALKELQSKIPDEVRLLTVSLITSDREGINQFRASIEAIQHRVSQLNPEQIKHDIKTLQSAIERAHSELNSIDKRVDEIALTQLSDVEVDGVLLRAKKLAEQVVSGLESYEWFDDKLSLASENAPPLAEEEAGRLREARRNLGSDIVYANLLIPSAHDLLPIQDVVELHESLTKIKLIETEVSRGDVLPLKSSTNDVLKSANHLLVKIEEAIKIAQDIAEHESDWPTELRLKCRSQTVSTELSALQALFDDIDFLSETRAVFIKKPVEFPEAGFRSPKTKEAVCRAATNGKPFGLISIGNGEAKEHLTAVRVAGLSPSSVEDWAHVKRFTELHEKILSFVVRWNEFAELLALPKLEGGIQSLRKIEIVTQTAKKIHKLAVEYDSVLPKLAEDVFENAPIKKLLGTAANLASVRNQLLRHLTKAELAKASMRISIFHEKLAGKSGPVSELLRDFVKDTIGDTNIKSEIIGSEYSEILAELKRIAGLSVEVSVVKDFAKRIEDAGAIKFARRITSAPVYSTGEDTVFPVTWKQAWNWSRYRSYLESIEARNELLELSARRRSLEGGLARLYQEMVAKSAWLACKRNSTPKVLQALAGYATAIRRIGQGTGPNATRYRRDARDAMMDAAGAVPCWIMNHNRISESMPSDIGVFDLVIVDEASQSDLWALPAILRGKKILVVGDDKQVSPDAGFIDSQRIQELKNRFLEDQPYGTEMTPEKSLYDLAARVFAAEQVMLREHFRCVPPIIAYSNKVFYKGGIQPIRIPKTSERIDPPLVDVYVSSGCRNKRDCNDLEAQAIAAEIAALLSNESYAGRTIGVVSLLGMEQAKYIDSMVRRRCDAAELLRRRFECGDARTFQGSERDIMFLSMVVDASNCKAVSGNLFEQRFNVAASRAKDRMYLVRSVKASELSEKDLRQTLLAHFDKPLVADKEEVLNLLDLCESGFEQQVYTELVARGYRVVPQVKTGAYRIDMVVEGANDARLAIECDGDEFHGPDRWQHDMNRQRVLERAGWIFWRCFASTWVLRRDEIISELVERLTAMGIEPMGAIDRIPSLVEKRTWQPEASENDVIDVVGDVLENAIAAPK